MNHTQEQIHSYALTGQPCCKDYVTSMSHENSGTSGRSLSGSLSFSLRWCFPVCLSASITSGSFGGGVGGRCRLRTRALLNQLLFSGQVLARGLIWLSKLKKSTSSSSSSTDASLRTSDMLPLEGWVISFANLRQLLTGGDAPSKASAVLTPFDLKWNRLRLLSPGEKDGSECGGDGERDSSLDDMPSWSE